MSVLSFATRKAASHFLPARFYRQRARIADAASTPDGNTSSPTVCLTFDDGPHPSHTPRVLDQLSQLDARATFFLIGGSAVQHPNIVRRIQAEGHAIGSHTHCHSRATRMSADEYTADALRARNAIEDITGIGCPLFRPPYGELTPRSLIRIVRNNMQIVHWTHEPKDSEISRDRQLVRWFEEHRPFDGAVVLLHDSRRVTACHLTDFLASWRNDVQFCELSSEGARV